MKRISKRQIVLLFSMLLSVGLSQACGSDTSPVAAAGGASGVGGAESTSGGASTGDNSTTGGNSAQGGTSALGGAIGQDCTPSNTFLAPTDGLVATFSDVDGGMESAGRFIGYPFDATAPKVSTASGTLHITQNTPATTAPQYTGVAIGFGHCVDASAFTGVEFSISGSFSGCTMKYLTGDVAHQDATTGAPYATGASGAYQPQSPIASSQLTSAPITLRMPFAGYVFDGNPSTPLDPRKIILLGWQFEIAASTTGASCVADIAIDNVKFY